MNLSKKMDIDNIQDTWSKNMLEENEGCSWKEVYTSLKCPLPDGR